MQDHSPQSLPPKLLSDLDFSLPFLARAEAALGLPEPSVPVFRRPAAGAPAAAGRPQEAPGGGLSRRLSLAAPQPARVWDSLNPVVPDGQWLQRNGLFPNASLDPASAAFDILRTRILQAMGDRGWTRLAVCAPGRGCGTSFVAANLALSLARRPDSRSVLIDLDLAKPSQQLLWGLPEAPALAEVLLGEQPLESQLVRIGHRLALGLNGTAHGDPGAVLHHPAFGATLGALCEALAPDLLVLDLPPLLARDEALAVLPHVDALLLVTSGRQTAPDQIRAAERLCAGRTPILGIVLNQAQDRPAAETRRPFLRWRR